MRVTVAGGVTVSGPTGSFRGTGKIVVLVKHTPSLPYGGSVAAAGSAVDIAFQGVSLARPLTISFQVGSRPRAGDVPVVAHQLREGSWTLSVARYAGGRITVQAQSFSLHVPGWLNPGAWMKWLGSRLASLIGGRTAPIACAGSGPAWATVTSHTDEAHTCLVPNVDRGSHAVRAEVQIKSNRGTALEVDVPPGASYTWVQDQPWAVRTWVWAHVIHQNPNLMTLLPAGATMTAGYLRPGADEDLDFQVLVSYWSLKYSLFSDVVDALSGMGAEATGIFTLYVATKCSGTVSPASLSVHRPLSTATFGWAFTCVLSTVLSQLSSPRKALGAARSLLGPDADQADLEVTTKELTAVGGKLLVLGWVLQLWPILQAGWGGSADVVHDLLTGGRSTLVDLHLAGGGTAYGSYLGRWYQHDYELCVGQAPDFSAYNHTTGELPCSGSSTSGYERFWGCGYPVGGCGFAWVPLTFDHHSDGTLTATPTAAPVPVPSPAGGAFYDDGLTVCTLTGAGTIVPCNAGVPGIGPEGVTPSTEQLSFVQTGVLKERLPSGYWGGSSTDVCSTAASQADQQRYCPNG